MVWFISKACSHVQKDQTCFATWNRNLSTVFITCLSYHTDKWLSSVSWDRSLAWHQCMEPAAEEDGIHCPCSISYSRCAVNSCALQPHELLDMAGTPCGWHLEHVPLRNKLTAANCEIIKFCLLLGCMCFTQQCLWKYLWSVKTQTLIPIWAFLISFTNLQCPRPHSEDWILGLISRMCGGHIQCPKVWNRFWRCRKSLKGRQHIGSLLLGNICAFVEKQDLVVWGDIFSIHFAEMNSGEMSHLF
jgi:hypothetical protein